MKQLRKIALIILTGVSTIAFLSMVAICITIKAEYPGMTMGNEANGYFTGALMLTFILSIPTIILWTILMRKNKTKPFSSW